MALYLGRRPGDPWHVARKPSRARMQQAVGRRVADLRAERGLTQEALAERIRISARYLRRIEAGEHNLTIGTLVRLANGLAVEVGALFVAPARRSRRQPPRK